MMLKRLLCFLCCALLALAPMAALAEGSFVMAGYDGEDSTHDWKTNQFFTRMEERTGVSFTFQQYDKMKEWQKAKDGMFAKDELPDVFFKAALTTDELIRYTQSGQLIDLKPLLAEHAPNLWQLLCDHPEWLEAITLPDGKIGALPSLQPIGPQNAMWINQKWLETLKLDVPTDFESLREVLTAFRDRDPNNNGKKDEIPMLFLGPWELKFFSHAFGVVADDYNIYLDEAGKVHYWPEEDSFFALAEELRGLFADGLLDPNGFTTVDALRRVTDNEADITYGAMISPTPVNLLPYDAAMQYVLMEPFAFEGRQIYRDLYGSVTRGTFAITSACEDPAALLRWVDVLYTEEGAIEAMVGIEGEQYEFDEDEGTWNWIGGIDSMTMTTLSEMSIYDTGEMPWMFPQDFYNLYEDSGVRAVNDAMAKLNALAVRPFPSVILTAEETEYVTGLQMQLGAYVDETLARLVLGEIENTPEAQAAFREGLKERGMDEMVAFWQSIADRP